MKKIRRQYRQGDVLIIPTTIPANAEKQNVTDRIVLAEGEATGHAHAVEKTEDVELFTRDGTLYLRVKGEVPVVHEEHAAIVIEPGDYEIRRQQETWLDEVRYVSD